MGGIEKVGFGQQCLTLTIYRFWNAVFHVTSLRGGEKNIVCICYYDG